MTKHEYISFGYLSGLKCHLSGLYNIDHTDNEKVNPITVEIVGIGLREVEIHEIGRTITEHYEICDCFPILRPLSDLNGEEGVGFDLIQKVISIKNNGDWLKLMSNDIKVDELPFYLILILISFHFDICGLIESGEAVDYHTLPDFVF